MSVAIGIPHIIISAEVNKLYSFQFLWNLQNVMQMNVNNFESRIFPSYMRNQLYYMYVPQVDSIVCTCTSGWWYCVYMYLRLVVLCVHVPQVGGIVCTCTSGW